MTPPNQPPVLFPIPNKTVNEGSTLNLTALAIDPDVGQTLTYSLDPGAPTGATINPVTGALTYTPPTGPAVVTITYRVTDNGSPPLSDSKTFTVTVSNVSPVVSFGPGPPVSRANFARSGSFSDPGVDTWTAQVDYGDGSGPQPLTLAGKTFQLNHHYNRPGAFTASVSVRDQNGGTGTSPLSVQIEKSTAGDFNGDGIADVGIYQPNNDQFYLDYLNNQAKSIGQVNAPYGFHTPGVNAIPITGDFNGDGITDVGIYLPDKDHFYLDYLNAQAKSIGQVDLAYGFHTPGTFAIPITGDFNGDGITDVGIYLPDKDHFYLNYLNAQAQSIGQVDAPYGFHTGGVYAVPITGDFNGDGITDVGIYQPNNDHFYLDYLNNQAKSIGQVDAAYGFHTGGVYAVPITGDFNGDGIADVGIYQPNNDHFYLDYLNNQAKSIGQVDAAYGFHTGGVYAVPIAGDFNGDGIADVGIYQPNNDHFYLDYLNNRAQSIGQVDAPYGFHTSGILAAPLPTSSPPASAIQTRSVPSVGAASSIAPGLPIASAPTVLANGPAGGWARREGRGQAASRSIPAAITTLAIPRVRHLGMALHDRALAELVGGRSDPEAEARLG